MPGAWEFPPPNVLMAILTREMVTSAWAKGFRDIILPPGSHYTFVSGMPYDHARNHACELALQGGYKYLFFLDDDVIPPPNIIDILMSSNLDIVSGNYWRRHNPVQPVALLALKEGGTGYIQLEKNDQKIYEVDFIGGGALLIKRKVLETMPKPWFEWWCDREDLPQNERYSEDFSFCRKAKLKHGFKIHFDTRAKCKHAGIGGVDAAKDGEFGPISVH
jgi:hypothetical protein